MGKKKAKTWNIERGGSSSIDAEPYELSSDDSLEDPLIVFGSGIMTMILNKLDARSVALSRLVSHGWRSVASTDRIWAPKHTNEACIVY